MSINPWEGVDIKHVLGFSFIVASIMFMPSFFVFVVYRKALQGDLIMIAVAAVQIYF